MIAASRPALNIYGDNKRHRAAYARAEQSEQSLRWRGRTLAKAPCSTARWGLGRAKREDRAVPAGQCLPLGAPPALRSGPTVEKTRTGSVASCASALVLPSSWRLRVRSQERRQRQVELQRSAVGERLHAGGHLHQLGHGRPGGLGHEHQLALLALAAAARRLFGSDFFRVLLGLILAAGLIGRGRLLHS